MVIRKISLALLGCSLGVMLPSLGSAEGIVTLRGSIIASACSIDMDSLSQEIDMGILPISKLRREGRGPAKPFSIRLVGCVLPSGEPLDSSFFSVTFDGQVLAEGIRVFGEAEGVVLTLQDRSGDPIILGQPTGWRPLGSGQSSLHYQLRLVVDHTSLRSGDYYTVLRFKLNYS